MTSSIATAWRLSVEHVTEFAYAGDVQSSYNEARISPKGHAAQLVLDHRVSVEPEVPVFRFVDYWGSEVAVFDVHERHQTLVVTGRSLVETAASPIVDDIGWEVLADGDTRDRWHEFLMPSALVDVDDAVMQAARDVAAAPSPLIAVGLALEWTRASLQYESGATHVGTIATEARALGKGVCQDFVHLALAVLRTAGIPARYASGYLHPRDDATIGETVVGQSHAWIEVWLGDWYAFDPTNGADVGLRHVLVARGRDYDDVVPVKGVFNGPVGMTVDARVAITRVA
jgi:transglutaminase-like putative cysteine protease